MPSSSEKNDAPANHAKTLRRHLAPLYRFAQVLTPSATEAATCVEDTYRRALRQSPETQLSRAHLFRLLLDTCADDKPDDPESLTSLHHRLAAHHLRRALPSAFVALSAQRQLLLLLVATERFSPADAGRILDLTPQKAHSEQEAAYDALRDQLTRSASSHERALLESYLSQDALNDALADLLLGRPTSVPPSLNQTVAELVSDPPSPAPPSERPAKPTEKPPSPSRSSSSSRWRSQLLTALLLIVMIGTMSLLAVRFLDSDASGERRDLIEYSVQHAPSVEPTLRTRNAQKAERFVFEKLGRRLAVPAIDSARLDGVGLRALADDAHVPVLLYDDERAEGTLPVYVYTYAVLDRLGEQFEFSEEALSRIQQNDGFATRQIQDRNVLIWRDRDDIFLAVTSGEFESLRRRIKVVE